MTAWQGRAASQQQKFARDPDSGKEIAEICSGG
jgi:hypothetical protein